MRGRARGTLLPDTPNKYLLVGEPKISLNKIFCLKESSGKKTENKFEPAKRREETPNQYDFKQYSVWGKA